MAEHEGWSYLDSDNMEEFSGRTSEEGWASQNSDDSGSFYGDDGSWGFINADGSGSYYGIATRVGRTLSNRQFIARMKTSHRDWIGKSAEEVARWLPSFLRRL